MCKEENGLERSATIGNVTRKTHSSTKVLSEGILYEAAVDLGLVSVR